jgi:hypothetical protein
MEGFGSSKWRINYLLLHSLDKSIINQLQVTVSKFKTDFSHLLLEISSNLKICSQLLWEGISKLSPSILDSFCVYAHRFLSIPCYRKQNHKYRFQVPESILLRLSHLNKTQYHLDCKFVNNLQWYQNLF